MARLVVCVALALGACTPAQSPAARRLGMVMSIGGVVGLSASALASGSADTRDLILGFSVISGVGVVTYAIGELSDPPPGQPPETEEQKLRRWARVLTERAGGAAREGRCARVRRLEKRVHLYDPEVHDFVFMRDAAILACLARAPVPGDMVPPALADERVALPAGIDPGLPAPVPSGGAAPAAIPPRLPALPGAITDDARPDARGVGLEE